MTKRFKECLIDLDIPVYRAASVGQKTYYYLYDEDGDSLGKFDSAKECKDFMESQEMFLGIDTGGWTRDSDVEYKDADYCYKVLDGLIKGYLKESKAEKALFSIDGEGNFRDSIGVTKVYKGNRTQERPKFLKDVKKYAVKKYTPTVCNGKESDDQISEWLYEDFKKAGGDPDKCKRIMVDLEKDCKTTCGWHLDGPTSEIYWQSELEANRWLFTQVLIGDTADNYGGCKGWGIKKATPLLEDLQTTEEIVQAVKEVYQEVYEDKWEDLYIENLRLAMMLRDGDPENDYKEFL